jgi:hypothetical protein
MARSAGKAPGGEFPDKSAVLSTRITPELRQALDAAAKASGRTLSQEIEVRLRYAFAEHPKIDPQTSGVLEILGLLMTQLRNPKAKDPQTARWFSDRYVFHQAVAAAVTVLNMFRPKGVPAINMPRDARIGEGRYQAASFAEALVADLQTADTAIAMDDPRAGHQLHMAALRERMGEDLADRPEPYGMTSEQYKRVHNVGRELGELMRKARRGQASPDDFRKIHNLAGQLQARTAKQQNDAA